MSATPFSRLGIRNLVQIGSLVLLCALGLKFALFVRQMEAGGPVTLSRPAGVEAFLPIGALMGWKRFLSSGDWDLVHPAAMAIFGFAVASAFLLRKGFCSWLCPVGTLSEWAGRLGIRLFGKNFRPPRSLDLLLQLPKYLLLGFFLRVILTMSDVAISMFLKTPYYVMADVKMLHFFTKMSATTMGGLLLLALASLFLRNFWCRYLCPYGALLGLFSALSPTRIRRNEDSCIQCGKCNRACPNQIPVMDKTEVISPECTACMDCVCACPVEETLTLKAPFGIRFSPKGFALVFLGALLLTVVGFKSIGLWESRVHPDMFREYLPRIDAPFMRHP